MKLLIDAFSWIEYLEGSAIGEEVHRILKNKEHEIFVLPITIAEVVSKTERKKGNTQLAYNIILENANIIETTPRVARETGMLHAQTRKKIPHFGIVDALLIATAKSIGARVLTGDSHFKSFKDVILVK